MILSRLETHRAILPIPIPSSFTCSHSLQWRSMGESAIASDSLSLDSSQDARIVTWWFETVIVGTECQRMGPGCFTKKLNDCRERLQPWPTLNKSSIFSYACREHSTVLVAAGQVAIEGFLKMWGTNKVRLGTLRRRLQHDSIIGDINWISIQVGRGKRYTPPTPPPVPLTSVEDGWGYWYDVMSAGEVWRVKTRK